jgi:hypothetical protein
VALLLSVAAHAQAAENLLLGNWKLSAGDPDGCHSPISFSANTQSLTMKGHVVNSPVTYNAGPAFVFAIGNTGAFVRYDILDRNHIKLHSWASCAWTRQ